MVRTKPRPPAMIMYSSRVLVCATGFCGATMVVIWIMAFGATDCCSWNCFSRSLAYAVRMRSEARTEALSVPVTVSHISGPWALSASLASNVPVAPRDLSSRREASELRLRARPSAMPVSEVCVLRKGLPS